MISKEFGTSAAELRLGLLSVHVISDVSMGDAMISKEFTSLVCN
jgi:hypothetical protein